MAPRSDAHFDTISDDRSDWLRIRSVTFLVRFPPYLSWYARRIVKTFSVEKQGQEQFIVNGKRS